MENSTVTPLVQPGAFCDLLTEVLRSGAQRLLAHAVEAEVAGFIDAHAGERLEDGRARIVRHGHLPARDIQTGIAAVRVQQPRVRDRATDSTEDGSARIHFFTEHIAQACPAHEELGCGSADPLFEGDFLWQLPRRAIGLAWAGGPEPVIGHHIALAQELGRGAGPLAGQGPLGPALCLYLGRWDLLPGSHGGSKPMYAGHYRRHAGGQERAARLYFRLPGKRPELG